MALCCQDCSIGRQVMTAQIHEVLFIDGEKMSMASCPPLPMDHPRIVAEDLDAVVKRSPKSRIPSCANTGSGETIRNAHELPLAAPARSQPNRDRGAVGSPKMSVAPLEFLTARLHR
jgi:hypothetical protein